MQVRNEVFWLPRLARLGAALLGCAVLAAQAVAQTGATILPLGAPPPGPSAPGAPPPGSPPPGTAGPGARLYPPEQLDQLVAPIALYPDDLVGLILMASTYPLEVVQADRWLQDPANASLSGARLTQALQSQPWDASVKALAAYPKIVSWMDNALDWTEAVGDAFLAQQPDVMDAVQRLRQRAQAAGTLAPTPQESVTSSDQAIQIASTDPNVEYVPLYNPDVAYGPWPYPDYPPYAFYNPGVPFGTFIAFPIVIGYWGWDHPDWHHHRIDIDGGPGPGRWQGPSHGPVPWRHDPGHRGGVPYRDPLTRSRYEGGSGIHSAGSGYRGYASAFVPSSRTGGQPGGAPAATGRAGGGERQHWPAPEAQRPVPQPRPQMQAPAPAPRQEPMRTAFQPRAAPAAPQAPMPPAMQSFGAGQQVHAQEMRGFASRVSPPAPAGGGAHGGHR